MAPLMNYLYRLLDSFTQIKVKLLDEEANPPKKAESGSAGYDIYALKEVVIEPHSRRLVSTGVAIEIPPHYYMRCAPRSGLSMREIDVGAGVIDSSYRGEVKVLLINSSCESYKVSKGDRIAQLVMERCSNAPVVVVDSLDSTERGEGGFGSTGFGVPLTNLNN